MRYLFNVMRPFLFAAMQTGDPCEAQIGDVLVVEPGAHDPVILYRPLVPDLGAIMQAHDDGTLTTVNPHRPVDGLRAAVGDAFRPAPPGSQPVERRAAFPLRRLK